MFDPSVIVGTWANATPVHLGRDEITKTDPEVFEIIRRVEARKIREYLEKRKRAS